MPTLRPATLAAALLLLAACRDPAPPPPPAQVDRYVVRGEIARLPSRPGDELSVRHEAIPAFKDRSGAVVGMDAMVMGFAVGKSLPLAGLAVGDKVRVTFAVDWAQPSLTIEKLEPLPADTLLQFGRAAAR
ncbi:MAG: copper-binding protein [Deltaproteobacteria bacterium]|nr:copper-binding protein [Deltaproteobacteria bacterium]